MSVFFLGWLETTTTKQALVRGIKRIYKIASKLFTRNWLTKKKKASAAEVEN
jgi:hypothetical protein